MAGGPWEIKPNDSADSVSANVGLARSWAGEIFGKS
jgi:hypothetical protein